MTTVFVEGAADQKLLERLLADLAPTYPFRIIRANGRDAARPLARKHLLTRREPVVLVLDAETMDEQRVAQQQRDLEDYMRWGGMQMPYAVLQFVPEAEVVFFENPGVLQRLLDRTLPLEVVEAGRSAPRKMLGSLDQSTLRLLNQLRDEDLNELRENEVVKTIRDFIVTFGSLEAESRPSRAS